jgi:hypothetical protein
MNKHRLTRVEVLDLFMLLLEFRETEPGLSKDDVRSLVAALDTLNTAQRERMLAEEDRIG